LPPPLTSLLALPNGAWRLWKAGRDRWLRQGNMTGSDRGEL